MHEQEQPRSREEVGAPRERSLRHRGVDVVVQLAQMVPVPLTPLTGGLLRRCTSLPRLLLRTPPATPAGQGAVPSSTAACTLHGMPGQQGMQRVRHATVGSGKSLGQHPPSGVVEASCMQLPCWVPGLTRVHTINCVIRFAGKKTAPCTGGSP